MARRGVRDLPWRWHDSYPSAEAAEQRLKDLTEMAPRTHGQPITVELSRKDGPSLHLALGTTYTDSQGQEPIIPYGVLQTEAGGVYVLTQAVYTRSTRKLAVWAFLTRYREHKQ